MAYRVVLKNSAKKELARLNAGAYQKVRFALDELAKNPRPAQTQKLTAKGSLWRFRVGDYRIIYEILDEKVLIIILRIGHRSHIYRRLQ